ncbi:MAG: hypothetical protein ACU0A6_11095 [Shimia sp.]|uniref:hypothetical protein n=1 Tax=Shimia sp. TaxID=1954381 RepID=UPI004058F488
MLRSISALCATALMLTACGPTSHISYSKSGASADSANRAFAECRQEANSLFPVAVFTSSTAGYGGYGGYYGGGAYGAWGGSYIQSTDANAGLRSQHFNDCMTLKGYRAIIHPICTTAQLNGRQYRAVTKPPTSVSPSICAARTKGGGTTLVDLSKPI